MEPYGGPNLLTSRSPSAIESHCRNSYTRAKRKLQASRAKVRFYVAGNDSFSAVYAVSPQRFSTFDKLLAGLTSNPLCRSSNGDQYIFNMNTSHKITNIDELSPGESYVCATYEVFDQLDKNSRSPTPLVKSRPNRIHSTAAQVVASRQKLGTSQSNRSNAANEVKEPGVSEKSDEQLFIQEIRPKLITILRAGEAPRKSIRILLTKKNTKSLEQVVSGITECLCPRNPIRRFFGTQTGKLVMCLADFFLVDNVFIAYCMQEKMEPDDLILNRTEVKTVGAYRFKPGSAYGRVTLASHAGIQPCRPNTMPSSSPSASRQVILSRQSNKNRAQTCFPGIPARPSPVPFSVKLAPSVNSRPVTGNQSLLNAPHRRESVEDAPMRYTERETPEQFITGDLTITPQSHRDSMSRPIQTPHSRLSSYHSDDVAVAEDTQYYNDEQATRIEMIHSRSPRQSVSPPRQFDDVKVPETQTGTHPSETRRVETEYTPVQTPDRTPAQTPDQEIVPLPQERDSQAQKKSSCATSRHSQSLLEEAGQSRTTSGRDVTHVPSMKNSARKSSRATPQREEVLTPENSDSEEDIREQPSRVDTVETPRKTSRLSTARKSITQYENEDSQTPQPITNNQPANQPITAKNEESATAYQLAEPNKHEEEFTEDVMESTEVQSTQADVPSIPMDTQMDTRHNSEVDQRRQGSVHSTAV